MPLFLLVASCNDDKEIIEKYDKATRVVLYPSPTQFNADGTTATGDENYVAVVTIAKGTSTKSDLSWEPEVVGSVSWVTATKTTVTSSFQDEFTGTVYPTDESGVDIRVVANKRYKRTFTVNIKVSDGTVVPFTFTQLGELPDAAVSASVKKVDFMAEGGDYVLAYNTNMGDAYAFSAKYGEGSSDWLTWKDAQSGKVTLTVAPWNNTTTSRTATLTITVGSDTTSLATMDIAITQLAKDNYYYIYGDACSKLPISKSIQMDKISTGVYSVSAYFMKSSDGKNNILFNQDSRTLSYPCFALSKDGTIKKLASASDAIPQGPAIDIDGMRSLLANFNDLTWSWSRITSSVCLPDAKVSSYETATITANGRSKVWMTQSLNFDPNAGISDGVTNHLGCPLVTTSPAGYGTPPLSGYDATKESSEYSSSGAAVDEAGTTAFGRLYLMNEILTGNPENGLEPLRLGVEWPWKEGNKIVDAVGNTVEMKPLTAGVSDFSSEPTTTMQVQGICPYGWHIANAQDFYDLLCAASEKAGQTPLASSAMVGKWTGMASVLRMSGWGDGTDALGIKFAPQGRRLYGSGWQYFTNPVGSSSRMEMFIFQPSAWGTGTASYTGGGAQVWRISAMKTTDTDVTVNATYNIGDCAASFRCVKNYK